jgi:hypothetical protein
VKRLQYTFLILMSSAVSASCEPAAADHKEWLKYFEGKWTSEHKTWTEDTGWSAPVKGSRECRLLADGMVVVDERANAER